MESQEWKMMILVQPFQLRIIYDSVDSMNASGGDFILTIPLWKKKSLPQP